MGSRRRDRRENRSPPTPPFSSQGLNPPATRVEPHRSAPRRAGAAPPRRVGRAEVKGAPGPGVGASGRQAGPSGALPRGLGPHSHPAAAVPTAASNPRPDGRLRSRSRSRGRGRDAEAARARPEPGPAQPVSAAGGRRRPRLPRFCSASASCSPRHAHRRARPRPPGAARPLSSAHDADSAAPSLRTPLPVLPRAGGLAQRTRAPASQWRGGAGGAEDTPHCACAARGAAPPGWARAGGGEGEGRGYGLPGSGGARGDSRGSPGPERGRRRRRRSGMGAGWRCLG